MTVHAATVRRVSAAVLLALAFVIMASVFSPDRTRADQLTTRPKAAHEGNGAPELPSADVHQGLQSLGSLETNSHIVQFYCTEAGPRYSIFDRDTHMELGSLLSAEQVERFFPEIRLGAVDFAAPNDGQGPLMLAEPIDSF